MDEIRIDNLEVYAHHGVYPEEQEKGQRFYVNAVLFLDVREAGSKDDLSLSVDYGKVCHLLTQWMKEKNYYLLETVAEKLAERLLFSFAQIREVSIEVRKPEAPIGLPFESVSVKIRRGWHKVYLSIGSNMGDREAFLNGAIEALMDHGMIRNVKGSTFLETKPYGGVEQDDFLNAALALETLLSPKELLELLHDIERDAGRTREVHWGPRTLDMDILFYDKLVYEDEELILPHVDLQNREFVLKPLCELAPFLRHPILGKTMQELLDELKWRDYQKI